MKRKSEIARKALPHLFPVLLLMAAVLAVYGRSLGYDFLTNWDDNHYVIKNADIQGFGWDRLKVVFTKYYVGNYAPVQMLSYMFDFALWGLHPGGYHATNLLLHAVNGLLLYRLLYGLTSDRLAAWSGAALFLLHPVQVETVVWISQRKTLLALLFFLLAWEWYLACRETETGKRMLYYAASLVALLLALLSKSVTVIFPVAMLLFDHCYYRGTGKRKLLDKVPYLLVSVLAAVLAIYSQTPDYSDGRGGGRAAYHGGSPFATFLTMLPVFCSYLRLLVWPFNLSVLYDPELHTSFDPTVVAALVMLCCVLYLIYLLYRFDRRSAFGPLFAILALLPVSQIVPLVTLINDRYLYFPLVGIAALLAYLVKYAAARWRLNSCLIPAGVCGVLLFFSILSFLRVEVWRDGIALWSDTVSKSPKLPLAWEGLGEAAQYSHHPNREVARKAYLQAIKLNPAIELSRYNLGVLYMEQNDFANADIIFKELLQLSPQNVMGWTAFGDLAQYRFDYEEAERRYRKALSLQPEAVPIHQKLGNLMVVTGRIDGAKSAFLRIEELQGDDPHNAFELARIEALGGNTGESVRWLEVALKRGFNDYALILSDEELVPIRMDARFGELARKYFPQGP